MQRVEMIKYKYIHLNNVNEYGKIIYLDWITVMRAQ